MIRPAIVLALLLASVIMMREVASDWRKGMPTPSENATKKAMPTGEAASQLPQAKALQPVVPGVLPDLKDGYLFNPERMLAGAAPPPPPVEEKGDETGAEIKEGIAASIDDVTYAGSIIADNFSRALILYKEKEADKGKTPAQPAQPASRSSKAKPPKTPTPKAPAAAAAGGEKHGQLEVGDVLDGYHVAKIEPDKLVFTKDDETVEKLLYDPGKKRQAPPPRAAAVPPGGAGLPRPAGIQSTTIGGAVAPVPPAPGGANPPIPPAPGAVKPPTPPAPGAANPAIPPAPPAIQSPTTPTAAGNAEQKPIRRMVISREPPARPDTSRVIRRSLGGSDDEQAVPVPPLGEGVNAPDPTATPPMPVGN